MAEVKKLHPRMERGYSRTLIRFEFSKSQTKKDGKGLKKNPRKFVENQTIKIVQNHAESIKRAHRNSLFKNWMPLDSVTTLEELFSR